MIQVNIPDNLSNLGVRDVLRTLSLSVAPNHKPAEFTFVEESGGRIRLTTTFDTVSDERCTLKLELHPANPSPAAQ